jgi:bifunctional ADP-heptose synthase (sugar kinase/adenylyltransferase)
MVAMIDPKSRDYETWYQANLLSARACEAWRKELADLEAARKEVATSHYAELVADVSKAKLKSWLMTGGSD